MKPLRTAAVLFSIAISISLGTCGSAVEPETTPDRWWEHIAYLASDELEGRATGSEGHRKAAQYIAEQCKQLGLEPGGTEGYLQPVEFETRRVVEEDSGLELLRNGKVIPLELGRHAVLGRSGQTGKTVEAEMVFVGYGQTVPEHDYDDFSGLDVRGKVVVGLRGAPAGLPAAWPPITSRATKPVRISNAWERSARSAYRILGSVKSPGSASPSSLASAGWI